MNKKRFHGTSSALEPKLPSRKFCTSQSPCRPYTESLCGKAAPAVAELFLHGQSTLPMPP
ncbi:Uncharacterised protein [Vibrio cholerae]|nr:Uncharacterised protein [Vibrio cholerae]